LRDLAVMLNHRVHRRTNVERDVVSGKPGIAKRQLILLSGRAHPELAESVAKHLGTAITPQSAYDFANGEIFVRFEESVRGADAFVMQSHSAPINDWLMEQLLMVDSLKRASAKRITAVMPSYPYARQDRKYAGREPISARLVANMFKTAGADRIVTVDLHTAQAQGFFDGPVDHLHAMWLLTEHVRSRYQSEDLTIVSPDAGRTRLAEKWADLLGGCPIAFIHKTRDPLRPNEVLANRVVGDVEGRTCVVVDDMIDTAMTSTGAARQLLDQGAKDVVLVATHGVLSGEAYDRLIASKAREVVLTDTLPIPHEKRFQGMTVLSIAPLLARAIQEVFEDGSVTSLFDGNA
jgi:ribose-phosphate pyrophosphokinase